MVFWASAIKETSWQVRETENAEHLFLMVPLQPAGSNVAKSTHTMKYDWSWETTLMCSEICADGCSPNCEREVVRSPSRP